MAGKVLNTKVIFAILVTLSFAYGVYEARSYDFLARIFPFSISLVLFVLALVNLIQEINDSLKKSQDTGSGVGDLEVVWDIPMTEVWTRLGFFIGLIVAVYIGIWIIGYPVSITLFIMLFYRHIAKSSWGAALIAGVCGMGFLILTSKVLGMEWPKGIIPLPGLFG